MKTPPKPVGTHCALAAERTSLEEGERGRMRDVRNATDFLFRVRYAAYVRVSPANFCVFAQLLLSSTLQANTNIPEAEVEEGLENGTERID